MWATNLFVHKMSSFCGLSKINLGVIIKWSSEAALKFEFYLSDWHFRLPVMDIKPRLFYQMVKILVDPGL